MAEEKSPDAINPFASPASTGPSAAPISPDDKYAMLGRIFVQWEKLRLCYNAVLLVIVIVLSPAFFGAVQSPGMILVELVAGCLAANVCFLAGPALDGYLSWFGLRHPTVTWLIFFAGTLLSVALTAIAVYEIAQLNQ